MGDLTAAGLRFASDFPSENCVPHRATRRARFRAESRGITRLPKHRDTPCYAVAALLSRGSGVRIPPGAPNFRPWIASSPAVAVRRAALKISPPLQLSSERSARSPALLALLLPGLRADVTLELIRFRHSQEGRFPVLSTQKELVQ